MFFSKKKDFKIIKTLNYFNKVEIIIELSQKMEYNRKIVI